MDKYTSPVSYFWGGICTLFGALSLNDIAIIVGIVISIATFLINWYYKHLDFKSKQQHFAGKKNVQSKKNRR